MESITEFKARISNYNILHGLETGEAKKVKGNGCLFCNEYEVGHGKGVEYVCSNCVILLLDATQEAKQKTYDKAIRVNSLSQAKALEMFIIPEGKEDEQQRPRVKKYARYSNRTGSNRPVRHKKSNAR